MSVDIRIPQPDDLDLAFFRASAEAGELRVQHCSSCGAWTHPARYFCPVCSSPDFSFDPVGGGAAVHSYTVSHFSLERAWQPHVPYVTIVAELAEGPRIVAAARDIAPDEVRIGMPVVVEVEIKSPEFAMFWARKPGG